MKHLLALVCVAVISGCLGPFKGLPNSGNRPVRPDEYFTDPKVVELCKAIVKGSIDDIKRCVREGADVNAIGKGNMTPLFLGWIRNGNKSKEERLPIFVALLELGANPNVVTNSGLIRWDGTSVDTSVAHECISYSGEVFNAVFEHGGDPNLFAGTRDTPLHELCRRPMPRAEKRRRMEVLLAKGADLNSRTPGTNNTTPMNTAISARDFEAVLDLLELGADPTIRDTNGVGLLNSIAWAKSNGWGDNPLPDNQQAALEEVVGWLESHGVSLKPTEEAMKLARKYRAELESIQAKGSTAKLTGHEGELKELYTQNDKIAREAWQKALAEDRAKEAAEGKGGS